MSPPRRRLTPDELLRSKVGANIRRSLRRLWPGDMEFDELCDAIQPTAEGVQKAADALLSEGHKVTLDVIVVANEMSLTAEAVVSLAKEMGLGVRPEPDCYLPTPDEIRLETAKFRSEWSQAERDARVQGELFGRME
jgi:hypothetical protein